MNKKSILSWITLIIALIITFYSSVKADNETDIYSETKDPEITSVETITPNDVDQSYFQPTVNTEENITTPNPNNSIPMTDLDTKNQIRKLPKVEGGNTKAVNILATKPSKARATITENVNQDAKDVTPKQDEKPAEPAKNNEGKAKIDMRQIMRMKTASGKEFTIIVDHGKDKENVQMLTEVSEQDLLNLIEGQSVEDKLKAEQEAERLKLEEEKRLFEENKKAEEERLKNEKNKNKESSGGSNIITIVLIVGVFVGGYFFYKNKKSKQEDLEVDEDDYSSDEDYGDEEDYDEYFEEE